MHADPKHCWDIATMTVKEALASWKGEAVKAAMEVEIRSLVGMGTWDLVERPRGMNIMKNRWVMTTKYRLDDTIEREKARLVVKGFTQVCSADYDETYSQKTDYFDDGTGRVCKLLKSLYGLKKSPVLWYRALEGVLLGAGWKKSQVDEALYFKASDDGVTCWVLVYGYANKVRRRFIDEEQGSRVPKMPVLVDAYADLTFDDEEAQENKEEGYRQKVGSLQFAATTTRPDIAFACSKLGSGLTLIGYVDADDAGDKQKWTSTSGYVFVYEGAAVSWSSSRIKCATLSSTESEYVAATNAGKEGRRLRFLLAEFKLLDAGKPTILRVDNKSAITVAAGLGLTGNLKHMERRCAWLQHMVRRGKFVLKYILTTEKPTDFLTKALHFPAFNQCSVAIGQVRLADVGDGNDDVQQ
ncbi:unnamed protein product [Closterium sp. NIES-53]